MIRKLRIEWGPDVGEIYYEAGTELIGPDECLGVLSKDGYVAQYISQLKAENAALNRQWAIHYRSLAEDVALASDAKREQWREYVPEKIADEIDALLVESRN